MAKLQTVSGSKRVRIRESQSQSKTKTKTQSLSLSIFQQLPHELLAHVLSFLPIKEAAQHSTLGTTFRNCTSFNRKFIFGREFAIRRNPELVTGLVDHLLDKHVGDEIDVFQLYIDPVGVEDLLDKWLNICVQKRIQDLDLYFLQPGYALTPVIINKLVYLTSLKLVYCELELPLEIQSMLNLRSLILRHVPFKDEFFQALIVHCRVLETIDLLDCTKLSRLEINGRHHKYFKMLRIALCRDLTVVEVSSPTLVCLHYSGHIPAPIKLKTPQLTEVFFNFTPPGSRRYLQASLLENLASAITTVTILTTSAIILEALSARFRGGVFGEACYSFLNLQELHLIMEGALFCNPYDIVMFMKRCPLLEKLFIDMDDYNFDCGPYWELHQKPKLDKFDHYFDRLKFIKLKGFKFLQAELELIKILLNKAIHLEALILVTPKNGRIKLWRADASRYDHLFNSWSASPRVNIVLFEHTADRSLVRPIRSKDWIIDICL